MLNCFARFLNPLAVRTRLSSRFHYNSFTYLKHMAQTREKSTGRRRLTLACWLGRLREPSTWHGLRPRLASFGGKFDIPRGCFPVSTHCSPPLFEWRQSDWSLKVYILPLAFSSSHNCTQFALTYDRLPRPQPFRLFLAWLNTTYPHFSSLYVLFKSRC